MGGITAYIGSQIHGMLSNEFEIRPVGIIHQQYSSMAVGNLRQLFNGLDVPQIVRAGHIHCRRGAGRAERASSKSAAEIRQSHKPFRPALG